MGKLPRWLRFTLIAVGALVVLALIVPYFLDLDRYRAQIIALAEKETGRKVEIGKIRARLIPTVGFTIENFKLSNPQGYAEGNLLEVEAIRGSLEWLPLLSKQIRLSGIELVRPKVTLLEDERGRSNYDFGDWEKKARQPASAEASAFRIEDIDSIEVSDVEVVMGAVSGRQRRVTPSLRVTGVSAELSDVALDTKKIKQWKADAGLSGVKLHLSGFKDPLEFTSGDFELREGRIDSEFEARLGKAVEAKGTLKVPDVEKAVAEFDLSTPLLDLNQLAAAGAETSPSGGGRSAVQRSELLAKGKLRANRIRYAPYEGSNATAEVRLYTDRLEMWPISMGFYDTTVTGTARVDLRQSPERFSSTMEVKSLDVAKVLEASGAEKKITGTAELTMQAAGLLGGNLLDSLTGSGNLAVRDGTLPGFDLGGLGQLAKVQKILTFGASSADQFSGTTRFNSVTADLALRSGRIHSQRIHLDSPSGTVDLRGSVGFDQTLSYDGNAVLMGGQAGTGTQDPIGAITGILGNVTKQTVGRVSVPFAVRGTVENPKIQPGRGIPGFSTASATSQADQPQTEEEQKKKKSIFDIFRKP